ncbi:hypothetical protein WKI68_07910 [Streptomyces sp. MS1.HAVA.3]|uniref:Uncharacterized protein n=1 Tax=Streptomyces caledonius TaxID=3134107 RepID=A0ABU8U0L9_9ACTN
MNTALLYRLLDADPAAGPAELLHRARADHHLPHLVLSALVRDGVRMGEPARAELRRAHDRVAHYARLAADLACSTGVRAIRGLPLAGCYPDGLLRPLDTLDLVAPDEAALWQAVIRLVTDHPVEHIDVSLLGERPHHTAVTVHWPAADPLVDPWYRVHLTTAALPGDGSAVPVRPYLVADEHVECLIALAESHLHRPALPPVPSPCSTSPASPAGPSSPPRPPPSSPPTAWPPRPRPSSTTPPATSRSAPSPPFAPSSPRNSPPNTAAAPRPPPPDASPPVTAPSCAAPSSATPGTRPASTPPPPTPPPPHPGGRLPPHPDPHHPHHPHRRPPGPPPLGHPLLTRTDHVSEDSPGPLVGSIFERSTSFCEGRRIPSSRATFQGLRTRSRCACQPLRAAGDW